MTKSSEEDQLLQKVPFFKIKLFFLKSKGICVLIICNFYYKFKLMKTSAIGIQAGFSYLINPLLLLKPTAIYSSLLQCKNKFLGL